MVRPLQRRAERSAAATLLAPERGRPTLPHRSPITIAAVSHGPMRVFVGESPVGKAHAAVMTLASARDPVPSGGRITACVEGLRVPVAYRPGETARAVCLRLALAVERRLGEAFAVRFESTDSGVASLHVAHALTRTESTTAEAALDRLASLLGNISGVSGLGATARSLVIYLESAAAAEEIRGRLPELSFLRWPVELSVAR